jgi:hypothetical protein
MQFCVVIEFSPNGPRGVYEGSSPQRAEDAYTKLQHGTIQYREGSTGHARDGSFLIRGTP